MYHCACCIPDVASFALIPSLKVGLRMSFHVFGACSGFTLLRLYEMPAKPTPGTPKYPAGLDWYSALYAEYSGDAYCCQPPFFWKSMAGEMSESCSTSTPKRPADRSAVIFA